MNKIIRRGVLIALAAVIIVALFAIFRTVSGHTRQIQLDTSGAMVSLAQNGDTIVFNPDGTYIIQGDVEIQGVTFTYETQGSYSVLDGKLVFNESAPLISVNSKFGSFELSGDIHTEIIDDALIVQLEASNESSTFELAYFTLGKEEADHLGVVGITAGSWEDNPNAENTENKEEETPVKDPPKLDAEGALLTIESAGNRIAFFPDNTFRLLAQFSQSDGGLSLTFDYSLEDRYEVKDGKLILPKETTGLLNSDFMASYGYTDVETPTKCSAEIVDGLLELHFVIQVDGGEKEVAVFKIGKEDAEKLGITGVEGATVVEEKKDPPAPTSSDNAPAQPSVASDAKPLSFSSGEYTITFYSNGQYKESGTVYAGGATVSVTVTDTYTIDENGTLSIRSGNQVSCYASMGGYDVSFGAPNNTACSGNSGGYTISFHVPANGQTYHVGTVTLSADDVKRIQENFGLEGDKPEPTPEPSPSPDDPSAENIQLNSEAGITLTFYPDSNTFDVTGKTVLGGMELASYSLTAPGTYSTVDNTLTLNPATLKITALHDMAKPLEGETEISFSVEKSDDNTLQIILPIGDPPVSYSMTSDQAKKIGIDLDTYPESSDVPSDPYTPDDSKTVIAFIKDYGAFTISGAGKFVVSGMEADLSFNTADTYTVAADGSVTAANTADALAYTITMFGQAQDATATPETTIVKDGDSYKVTLIANVSGQTITLCEGTVKAEDVITEETPASPYTPDDSKTVITFMKDYGAFTISGAGKFVVSGMEADLTFTAADTYSVADDGTVTAANTADAISYTVTMFGQSSEAKTTPTTVIVKDGDSYKVTLTANVNGQTITLCSGVVSSNDVIKAVEETPAVNYSSTSQTIHFDKSSKSYTASGGGTMSTMGMDIPITFSITDAFSVSADESISAANTSGSLNYTALGSPGTADPVTTISKSGEAYHITIQALINGQSITLLDQNVSREDVIAEDTAQPLSLQSTPKHNAAVKDLDIVPSLRDDASKEELTDAPLAPSNDEATQALEAPADSKSDEKESVETPTT